MNDFYSGLGLLLIGLAMLVNSLYGVVAGEVFFPARGSGSAVIAQMAQLSLFWSVVAFCAVGGCIVALVGFRQLRGTD